MATMTDTTGTLMLAEAGEASARVADTLARNAPTAAALARHVAEVKPAAIVTCARGSSDHAATFAKYVLETLVGIPVSSAAPSVASVYAAPLRAEGVLMIAISQSGRSPDLLATIDRYRAAGAKVAVIVNDEASPMATRADWLFPIGAGPERSVAATKSFILSLAVIAEIAAVLGKDASLGEALDQLPAQLAAAFDLDWTPLTSTLADATNLFVLGRGYGLGIAQEAALKLKETCALHAEAFSSAEVRHGPMAIVGDGFPVIAFAGSGHDGDDVRSAMGDFAGRGACPLLADASGSGGTLPAIAAHPVIEPILMIQSFYRAAEALARNRGLDPDSPPHLRKVTETR
ncbi:MAG TPA: iron dicitrate transport regulator FecR [Sphingomonas bacterium]|jgi:glucosamine--fructose-6-phosphate aminotransferase (isomerizing)|uniref:Iron dicitrate transport regulator FecR n=1 Tax=Sphingomonas bacterium TaxID=1895847 RepID=A0A3D0WCF4_9SPHN|nr:iron dicitrate transport regulator FecR [Sphingomonas bacterium]